MPARNPPNNAQKKIILGAHYDVVNSDLPAWRSPLLFAAPSIATPGADDNGSGVVGLFALMDRFLGDPVDAELEFVFFDAEEPGIYGGAIGSEDYVKKNLGNSFARKNIQEIFIIDMIGRRNTLERIPAKFIFRAKSA